MNYKMMVTAAAILKKEAPVLMETFLDLLGKRDNHEVQYTLGNGKVVSIGYKGPSREEQAAMGLNVRYGNFIFKIGEPGKASTVIECDEKLDSLDTNALREAVDGKSDGTNFRNKNSENAPGGPIAKMAAFG